MKTWKVGLIGCGGMAAAYRELYTKIPGVELDYVVALTEEEARETAELLGVKHYSAKYEDCLNSDVDIVDISTPNHLHKEQFVAAVKAGKHVLLQKPIAPNLEDALEILEVSRQADVKTGMFMSKRGIPAHHEMKKMIEAGLIGEVVSVHARVAYIRKADAAGGDGWRSSLEMTGGGALIQLGIHDYDLLQWMLGERITAVTAFSDNRMSPHIGGDDLTQSMVRFESGIMGIVESCYCSTQRFLNIYGTEGILSYANGRLMVKGAKSYKSETVVYDQPGAEMSYELPFGGRFLYRTDNPYEQHIGFVQAVMKDKEVPVSIYEGYQTLQVVKAAYESARTGKTIRIDPHV